MKGGEDEDVLLAQGGTQTFNTAGLLGALTGSQPWLFSGAAPLIFTNPLS